MNLYDALLKSMPIAAFKLNSGGTAYINVAGTTSGMSGTIVKTSPLTSGNSHSSLVGSSTLNFPIGVFDGGLELRPFSLEAWVCPLTAASAISILSHNDAYDGLVFDGNNIRFRVASQSLGNVDILWPVPDFSEAIQVVGTYSDTKTQLYVNGRLVEEEDLIDGFLSDGFATTTEYLYSGQNVAGTQRLAVDGIAVFNRVLTPKEILYHFNAGRDVPSTSDIVSQYGGGFW